MSDRGSNYQWFVSIDVGSTFTKGALFASTANKSLTVVAQATAPTTVDTNLLDGFAVVERNLRSHLPPGISPTTRFSSSAKGGLGICAIGVVPDLTLKAAKLVAFSAGAKILSVHAYKLTDQDIDDINQARPDIILFSGGTDGGNETHVRHNARKLERIIKAIPIIYAGNRAMRDEIREVLKDNSLIMTDNILPTLDSPSPEPARNAIRNIFLKEIIRGKGLTNIIEHTGTEPQPTPLSVFEFLKTIPEHNSDWSNFCVIDIGGATTDVYSIIPKRNERPGTVVKGLPEPRNSRTVEGDLGLRVCAKSTAEAVKSSTSARNMLKKVDFDRFFSYIDEISVKKETIPWNKVDKSFDVLLAATCAELAIERHCGTIETVYTPDGPIDVQVGKNLSQVDKLIGTGGFLSVNPEFSPASLTNPAQNSTQEAKRRLTPEKAHYFVDTRYLTPLIANIAPLTPEASVKLFIDSLTVESAQTYDN